MTDKELHEQTIGRMAAAIDSVLFDPGRNTYEMSRRAAEAAYLAIAPQADGVPAEVLALAKAAGYTS